MSGDVKFIGIMTEYCFLATVRRATSETKLKGDDAFRWNRLIG
jgi:hypothetical protein